VNTPQNGTNAPAIAMIENVAAVHLIFRRAMHNLACSWLGLKGYQRSDDVAQFRA
jgi:hypothetical protein